MSGYFRKGLSTSSCARASDDLIEMMLCFSVRYNVVPLHAFASPYGRPLPVAIS